VEALASEIEVLLDQIAVLEEGLTRASGMERAALAKEINAYRERLEAAQKPWAQSTDQAT
jgi:hypothetical protein